MSMGKEIQLWLECRQSVWSVCTLVGGVEENLHWAHWKA